VKLAAGLSEKTQSINNEISTLTSTVRLILGGASNDLEKCKAKTAFKSIINCYIKESYEYYTFKYSSTS
jgi:hypothetical protein